MQHANIVYNCKWEYVLYLSDTWLFVRGQPFHIWGEHNICPQQEIYFNDHSKVASFSVLVQEYAKYNLAIPVQECAKCDMEIPVQECTKCDSDIPVQECTKCDSDIPVQACTKFASDIPVQECTKCNSDIPVQACAKCDSDILISLSTFLHWDIYQVRFST